MISGVLPLFFMEGALIYPRYYLPFGLMAAEAFLISYIFAYLLGMVSIYHVFRFVSSILFQFRL